jgi:hypothetical protein
MSWRIVSEPIWRSKSNFAQCFSVPPLAFALPVKTSPLDVSQKIQKTRSQIWNF